MDMETLKNPSLFWDVQDVNPRENKKFIINRILSYGDEKDFSWALNFYGKDVMADNFSKIRDMDKKSNYFWCQFFNLDISICTPSQSAKKPSAFWKR